MMCLYLVNSITNSLAISDTKNPKMINEAKTAPTPKNSPNNIASYMFGAYALTVISVTTGKQRLKEIILPIMKYDSIVVGELLLELQQLLLLVKLLLMIKSAISIVIVPKIIPDKAWSPMSFLINMALYEAIMAMMV